MLDDHGQLVAIIPRSFCNGPYYRPFRNFILGRAAIRQMHLFMSRSKAFKDDGVLQENIIIRLECGGEPGPVVISTSTDEMFNDFAVREYPFDRIVIPDTLIALGEWALKQAELTQETIDKKFEAITA